MNFRAKTKTENPSFQVAPMVDVMFLLVSFFVSTQIFSQWETEIDVKLPTAQTGEVPRRLPGEIIINILADGTMVVNRQTLDEAGLEALLKRVVRMFPGQPVTIRADRQTSYEAVIRALDACRRTDVWNISFATSAEEAGRRETTF